MLVGDALEVLRTLPASSVDCVATSPPFYGLRDYDVDGQIGLEETPEQWAGNLVAVFEEVRRVLRDTGTLWVECGDSYAGSRSGPVGDYSTLDGAGQHPYRQAQAAARNKNRSNTRESWPSLGIKPKDIMGTPWLLAFALRADGWWLRQAIVWHKPNAMPESAKDRCTTAHSYVFLFSKKPRYWFDADAIAEPAEWARWGDQTVPKYEGTDTASGWMQPKTKAELEAIKTKKPDGWATHEGGHGSYHRDGREKGSTAYVNPGNRTTNGQRERTGEMRGFDTRLERADGMKNARSVWTIATKGYPGAHYATWPEALATRIIRAGCPRWVCATCGVPRTRLVERTRTLDGEPYDTEAWPIDNGRRLGPEGVGHWRKGTQVETLGWTDCGHDDYRPGVVLDPFGGSGTTGVVALRERRSAILIELNQAYVEEQMRPRLANWHRDPVRPPKEDPDDAQISLLDGMP